ncbi:MAG: ferredoxin reductase family protein [Candidatus Magasanikbacteria bacterium]|nr:ferredoxin reductase family protein [Candidatus Magasanikbacteria bacterium]
MKRNVGIISICLFALIPILIWLNMVPLVGRFGGFSLSMTSLGQVTGLIGMVLFSLDLVLSARIRWLEQYFWGLNSIYIWHHILGGLSLIFLLFHPILLVYRYVLLSLDIAVKFLFPGPTNPAVALGVAALFLMMFLLVLTFYFRPKYNIWKSLHRFLGLAFLFAVGHVFLITSDTSRNLFLRYYILGWAAMGILCIIYRSILHKYLVERFTYTVSEIKKLDQSIWQIFLQPQSKKLSFQAGQFVFVGFRGGEINGEFHPFSIASSPLEENLQIVIKSLGDYTANLDKLKVGDRALVEGSFGIFTLTKDHSPKQIWIAGGIGITPFLSMAKSLTNEIKREIELYYCVNEKTEAIFYEELKKIEEKNVGLKIFLFCSKEKGRISAAIIKEMSGGVEGKDIFVCGPPMMMKSLKQQFIKLNVPKKHIHSEEFGF